MNVLVTGATGFVGRNVMKRLASEGISVFAHRRSKLKAEDVNVENNRATFLFHSDLADLDSKALRNLNIDAVIHCAGLAHTSNPKEEFIKVNTDLTLSLANSAAKAGVRRFIFLSTIGVNGESSGIPFTASDIPNPGDDYSRSKLLAEIGLEELSMSTDMEVVIIRPPLIYGKNAPGNFSKLVKLASTPLPKPFGRIRNKRSFVSIDNLVDFILCCLIHPRAANETFLVSDGDDLSTTEFLREISAAMSLKPMLVPIPITLLKAFLTPFGLVKIIDKISVDLQIDISKNQEMLCWKPPLTIYESLRFLNKGY